MSDLTVKTKHLFTIPYFNARPGFCRSKSREWAEAHGIDWRSFVRDGVPASVLTATDDALALRLVEWARECESKEHG